MLCLPPFFLQGIKAVLAESYERIHRSNLVGMGVIPLQFLPGQSPESLGLTGRESYTITLPPELAPGMMANVSVSSLQNRPIACDVTFGHFRIRLFGRRAMLCDAGGQKCIAVIERKALNISLFTNASDYSNKTCTERSMCLYLTNMIVSLE